MPLAHWVTHCDHCYNEVLSNDIDHYEAYQV